MKHKKEFFRYIEILCAGVAWALGGLYNKKLTAIFSDPKTASFYSQVFALIALFLFLLLNGKKFGFKIDKRTLFFTIIYGVFTKGVLKVAYDSAIFLTGIATTTILVYTAPIFAFVMSMIFFREKANLRKTCAVILNVIGCALVVTRGNFTSLDVDKLGLILGLLCGFFYALSTIITIFPIAKPWATTAEISNLPYIKNAIIYGAICVALPNCLMLDGLSKGVDASKAPILSSVEVIVASLIGAIMFSEEINIPAILGVVVILSSIVIMNTEKNTDKIKRPRN